MLFNPRVLSTIFLLSMFVACKDEGSQILEQPNADSSGSSGKDFYLVGYVGQDPQVKPAYWHSGVVTVLSKTLGVAYAAATHDNDNVYTLGYDNSNFSQAALWTNETLSFLDGYGNDIAVEGENVYVAGSCGNDAALWKNGNRSLLTHNAGVSAQAQRVIVKDGSVHIGIGILNNDLFSYTTIYWKDGLSQTISSSASFIDMTVSGSDVYLLGVLNDSMRKGIIWKNGVVFCTFGGKVTSEGKDYQHFPSGICLLDGFIYISGVQTDFQSPSPCYWKVNLSNKEIGSPNLLPYEASPRYIYRTSIGSVGGDVYISAYDEGAHKSLLWKNGMLVAPFDGTSTSLKFYIGRICVVN